MRTKERNKKAFAAATPRRAFADELILCYLGWLVTGVAFLYSLIKKPRRAATSSGAAFAKEEEKKEQTEAIAEGKYALGFDGYRTSKWVPRWRGSNGKVSFEHIHGTHYLNTSSLGLTSTRVPPDETHTIAKLKPHQKIVRNWDKGGRYEVTPSE